MSMYAIAIIREITREIKIRILNTYTGNCEDCSLGNVKFYGNSIVNLEIGLDGDIRWCQGSMDRYPRIDRISNTVVNINNITVIGVSKEESGKTYRVSNYRGETVSLSEEKLIEYGSTYQLCNCKILNKADKKVVSAIEGTIEKLSITPEFKINYEEKALLVNVPIVLDNTLEIPSIVDGRPTINILTIIIKPVASTKQIKHLILPESIDRITSSLFFTLRDLEEITLKCNSAIIYDNAFVVLSKLRKINMKSIKIMGKGICSGLSNLEEINLSDRPPIDIQPQSFEGCKKFKINSILKEGVKSIHAKAFVGNQASKEIIIPKSVFNINTSAFHNCEVETVRCLSDTIRFNINSFKGLFSYDKKNGSRVKLILSSKASLFYETNLDKRVDIVRLDSTEEDIAAGNKLKKSKLLGINLPLNRLIVDKKEMEEAIVILDQKSVSATILSLVEEAFNKKDFYRSGFKLQRPVTSKPFNVIIGLEFPEEFLKSDLAQIRGNYLAVRCKHCILLYPVDKYILQNYYKVGPLGVPKFQVGPYVYPIKINRNNLKTIEISENGSIRAIYRNNNDDNDYSVTLYDQYKISDIND